MSEYQLDLRTPETDAEDSPHGRLPEVKGEVYVGCAENDQYAPPEMVDAFSERPAYGKDASERHWERLRDLFARTLS
jgi:carboxymethylenebutenolidase